MDEGRKKELGKIANTIKGLSIDGVQKANSGHPGLPLGCAELGAFLFAEQLNHYPKDPKWLNRDRFVLSAGHGSMWLYSCLHLSGFDLSLDELKRFRQLHSKTPGHPEFDLPEGVEATTGPLGQGIGNAVGMALGLKILAKKFNTDQQRLFTSKVYCLAGDGCIMEGVSSEASSFAGHLGLDNLILMYDANKICLDGPISECLSEDTKARYQAYGWEVHEIDGYDFDQMQNLFSKLKKEQTKPVLVIVRTVIGHGSPNKAGTHKVHGSPLGPEEVLLTKKALGLPEEEFFVPQMVRTFFSEKIRKQEAAYTEWRNLFHEWRDKNPKLYQEFKVMVDQELPTNLEELLNGIEIKGPVAGRAASQTVLQQLGKWLPQLYGGSADLSCSDLTMMKDFSIIKPHEFVGRNIKFGVREFGMGTITNGLFLTQMILPYCGTFLTFSDYMRNSIRLAALSRYHVIYQFTHDSIFLGEDGPTHQPVEQLASLRAIPGMHLLRPADSNEVKMAWLSALRHRGPTALILSRQNLPNLEETKVSFTEGVGRGGYIVKKERSKKPDYTLFATGSELSLALEVARRLETVGKSVRVISMVSFEIFEEQDATYKDHLVGGDLGKRVSIEAATEFGWARYIGRSGVAIAVEGFGASANMADLAESYGFTVDAILERIL